MHQRVTDRPLVLYVGAEPLARSSVASHLRSRFNTLAVGDGLAALDFMKLVPPDLVIFSPNLPDLPAETFVLRARDITDDRVPIFAVCERPHPLIQDAGCTGVLPTPLTPDAVARMLVDQRIALPPPTPLSTKQAVVLEQVVRERRQDEAELQNLAQAKETFLVQISHELRAPLTLLTGFTHML